MLHPYLSLNQSLKNKYILSGLIQLTVVETFGGISCQIDTILNIKDQSALGLTTGF